MSAGSVRHHRVSRRPSGNIIISGGVAEVANISLVEARSRE